MSYSRLDPAPVRATVARLCARIEARFPGRGIVRVANELLDVVDAVAAPGPSGGRWLEWLRRSSIILIGVLAVAVPVAIIWLVADGVLSGLHGVEWLGVGESAINDAVFAGIAIAFLWAVPARLRRGADLRVLHRLRSLAHVVDMHQLTKDPDRFRSDFQATNETVPLDLSPGELANYLEYCSELLSLTAKTAALLAEDNTDPAVLSAVSDVESLTSDLSRKMWSKIALLQQVSPDPSTPGR